MFKVHRVHREQQVAKILSSPVPYLDWRPDNLHFTQHSCVWVCVFFEVGRCAGKHTHRQGLTDTHTPTHSWLRRHQQHPSKLSWPCRLSLPLGLLEDTFSGFCLDNTDAAHKQHTPPRPAAGNKTKETGHQTKRVGLLSLKVLKLVYGCADPAQTESAGVDHWTECREEI